MSVARTRTVLIVLVLAVLIALFVFATKKPQSPENVIESTTEPKCPRYTSVSERAFVYLQAALLAYKPVNEIRDLTQANVHRQFIVGMHNTPVKLVFLDQLVNRAFPDVHYNVYVETTTNSLIVGMNGAPLITAKALTKQSTFQSYFAGAFQDVNNVDDLDVPRGIAKYFIHTEIMPNILKFASANDVVHVVISGYSLGGMIGRALLLHLAKLKPEYTYSLYTFGSPGTGSAQFNARLNSVLKNGRQNYNFQLEGDPIQSVGQGVQPSIIRLITKEGAYTQMTSDAYKRQMPNKNYWSLTVVLRFFSKHAPENYRQALSRIFCQSKSARGDPLFTACCKYAPNSVCCDCALDEDDKLVCKK